MYRFRLIQSAQGPEARRHTAKELARSWGGALDAGTVVRGFLKSAQGPEARRHTAKELARSSGGALDTESVVRGFLKSSLLVIITAAAFAQTGVKRPLNHRDYDGWRAIQSQVLSHDGKFLAYGLFPEEGDGQLVVRNLATGKEVRENAGAVPPAPVNQDFEAPAEGGPPLPRSIRISFTHDDAFVVAGAFPSKADTDKATKEPKKPEQKKPEEMPPDGMIIVNLATMTATRVTDVASFQVPESGASFVAYLRGPKAGGAPAHGNAASADRSAQGPEARRHIAKELARSSGGALDTGPVVREFLGTRSKEKYGSDLLLRDLRSAKERTFEDVTEYSIAKDAGTLVYAVSSKKQETNGVYSVQLGTDSAPEAHKPPDAAPNKSGTSADLAASGESVVRGSSRAHKPLDAAPNKSGTSADLAASGESVVRGSSRALLTGKGRYTKLTWDFPQKEFAFLSDRDDAANKPAKFKAYLWDRKGQPVEVVSTSTLGFRSGYGIAERGPMNFSRDGSRLFLSCAPLSRLAALQADTPPPSTAPSGDKVLADLWSWKDDYVQPMQKVRATQEKARSYPAVLNIADRKFIQITDPAMAGLFSSDNGNEALGLDDRAYRRMVDYDGNYSDVYLVDTATGTRKLAVKQYRGLIGGPRRSPGGPSVVFSPDGKHLLLYKERHWWSVNMADGQLTNLTGKLGTAFYNEDDDQPEEPAYYGSAGWTKDGKWALVYDRYDMWAVSPDGSAARNLTNGRASHLEFRLVQLEAANPDEERGVDIAKSLLFRAQNLDTRDSGFYSLTSFDHGQLQKLIFGPKNYRALGKAKNADVVMITAASFRDEPDILITDSSFQHARKVTDENPQKQEILWGTSELIPYRSADGAELQAALYKPENFDPAKKYPMMVYLYERLTQNVNNFVRPAPGTSINISYYVSNGYLVLTPDIVYTIGHPGQSALKCVLPAVQAVVDKGFVNRGAIGIQGHSWGGYQTAYMLTQTNVFRAAEAGAPVADMISAYDGIRWGTGLPRQFQYEKTQSRIGGNIWQYPMRFIENSPIFMVDRVTTPVLILENDGDDAVPWYQGLELFLSLRRLGKEVYLWNYNGEAHGLRKRPSQKDYTVRMQQFFDHFLKGAPEPAWMTNGIPYIDREREKEKINAMYGELPSDAKKEQ